MLLVLNNCTIFNHLPISRCTALFAWRCLLPRPQLSVSTVTNYKQQSPSKRRITSPPAVPSQKAWNEVLSHMFPQRWDKHQPDRTLETLESMCSSCPASAVPKGAGAGGVGHRRRGAPAAEPEAGWDGGGCLGGWMVLAARKEKASCGGTLQCLQWPQDVSQMQKRTSGWCSSGIFLEKSSKDHLLHAERRLHIGYRRYQPFGRLWLTVKSIGGKNALQDIDGRCIFFRLKNTLMLCLTFHYVLLLSELRCS